MPCMSCLHNPDYSLYTVKTIVSGVLEHSMQQEDLAHSIGHAQNCIATSLVSQPVDHHLRRPRLFVQTNEATL